MEPSFYIIKNQKILNSYKGFIKIHSDLFRMEIFKYINGSYEFPRNSYKNTSIIK
ncbi:MAG TPA: hypothetical protein QKA14_01750 [Candidatus Megaira endosymbiont of Hartmannula sinica]|nr:hypothetical protein [Candidatus Megaera endosymbiont of Hartmannula sinica]